MRRKSALQAQAIEPPRDNGRFSDQICFLVCDCGNRYLKKMNAGDRQSATVIENSVCFMDAAEWKKQSVRYRTSPARYPKTELFAYRSRVDKSRMIYAGVGNSARNYGQAKQMTEENKYDYDMYWGAIIISQLLMAFPNGNDHIVIALGHPTKSIGQRDMMINATLGRHHVETVDGRNIRFTVREVLPWEEAIGGVICWSESLSAQYNPHELSAGDMILVVDIGGGVTSFTRVEVGFEGQQMALYPVYDQIQSPSISMGSRNVLDKLHEVLNSEHPAFTGMNKNLTDRMLEQGLRTGFIELSGIPVDVRQECGFAEYGFLDQIENLYINRLSRGRPFKLITNTGGGMHIYHERLIAEFLNHPRVEPAISLEWIHYANLIGADEIFRQWIVRERSL